MTCHFSSRGTLMVDPSACLRSAVANRSKSARIIFSAALLLCLALVSTSFAQAPFPTSLGDNARTAANTTETLLSPSNVNKNDFGRLFSFPTDYVAQAQPVRTATMTMTTLIEAMTAVSSILFSQSLCLFSHGRRALHATAVR